MPAEAHRLSRGVDSRDRVVIAAVTTAAVTMLAVGLAAAELRRTSNAGTCVSVAAAGVMGGGAWRLCGADALAYCASRSGSDRRCGELAVALQGEQRSNR